MTSSCSSLLAQFPSTMLVVEDELPSQHDPALIAFTRTPTAGFSTDFCWEVTLHQLNQRRRMPPGRPTTL
jgi:hypothetical protein